MLQKVTPCIEENSAIRNSILASHRFHLTLRVLATGEAFEDLTFKNATTSQRLEEKPLPLSGIEPRSSSPKAVTELPGSLSFDTNIVSKGVSPPSSAQIVLVLR